MDPSLKPAPPNPYTLQEKVLGTDMLRGAQGGAAVVGFVFEGANRIHKGIDFTDDSFARLTDRFKQDPKNTLGVARESLFAIGADERLSPDNRVERLGRYFDAYTSMTIRLDHAAFPADESGVVHDGMPEYLPDGFVDLGSSANLDPKTRDREGILLDKAEVYKKYREQIIKIFSDPNIITADNETRKRLIAGELAQMIYFNMPYARDASGEAADKLGGGNIPLSSLDEGVCRHQAIAFQALAQAFGLTTRVLKNDQYHQGENGEWKRGGKHVVNLIRINGKWQLIDVTQPDSQSVNGGQKQAWRPATFHVDGPPNKGEARTYVGKLSYSGKPRRYDSRPISYWRIDR